MRLGSAFFATLALLSFDITRVVLLFFVNAAQRLILLGTCIGVSVTRGAGINLDRNVICKNGTIMLLLILQSNVESY